MGRRGKEFGMLDPVSRELGGGFVGENERWCGDVAEIAFDGGNGLDELLPRPGISLSFCHDFGNKRQGESFVRSFVQMVSDD